MRKIEVLAPAGSFDSMKAAINAGADAVYLGGSRFGARAYAENLDQDRLLEAIDYAHLHGVSLYMTVNTLVKEQELDSLYEYLLPYYKRGLDAVIVQDFGVLASVRRWFPDMRVHASTQMTVTGADGARILKEAGVSRVVAARELSLEELREIRRQADMETEVFVHGALCYCYSGQCLLSSLIGGRSGNRGRCAQPCRLPYDVFADGRRRNAADQRYLMSMKDLCTLDILPDILENGADSLKIEGRMKSPRYTAGVTAIYRKYTDLYLSRGRDGYHVETEDRRTLLELFDRGGRTEGYFRCHNGRDMVVLKEKPPFRRTDQALSDDIGQTYVNAAEKKESLWGRLTAEEGKPLELAIGTEPDFKGKNTVVTVSGPVIQAARSQPAAAEQLEKQIRKTGGTPFRFDRLDVFSDGGGFIPVRDLNRLRREGLSRLEEAILEPFRRTQEQGRTVPEYPQEKDDRTVPEYPQEKDDRAVPGYPQEQERAVPEYAPEQDRKIPGFPTGRKGKAAAESAVSEGSPRVPGFHVLVSGRLQWEQALREEAVSEIQTESDDFPPSEWKKLADRCHGAGKACVLAMPVIFRAEARAYFLRHERELGEAGFDGMLVRNLEEVKFLRERGVFAETPLCGDYSLYVFNREAAGFLSSRGVSRMTYPTELNGRELSELSRHVSAEMELAAYGRLPVMVTAQCVCEISDGCACREEQTRKMRRSYGRYGDSSLPEGAGHLRRDSLGERVPGQPGRYVLRDRTGREFPVRQHCLFCYNVIYNSEPLSLLGMEAAVETIAPAALRLQFLDETPEEMSAVIDAYRAAFREGRETVLPLSSFTRGHMKRGVE